jgi:hypothetical protein
MVLVPIIDPTNPGDHVAKTAFGDIGVDPCAGHQAPRSSTCGLLALENATGVKADLKHLMRFSAAAALSARCQAPLSAKLLQLGKVAT